VRSWLDRFTAEVIPEGAAHPDGDSK
jgi:hypothetical protein